jgi:hypothetical protein
LSEKDIQVLSRKIVQTVSEQVKGVLR